MRGTYSRLLTQLGVSVQPRECKINLSNEIGLSAQYVTQWDATPFLFTDPP